jgi:alpha-tubulin suppressor-like RCC1 family protein
MSKAAIRPVQAASPPTNGWPEVNAQARVRKQLQYLFRTSIVVAAALTTVGLLCSVAAADTVNAIYNSATDVPVTANGYTATCNSVNFTLNFAPTTGTDLTVVCNSGLAFINGTFDNLGQGQAVALAYGGVTYRFVANYYGGSGNDLVLIWASSRTFAWGSDASGQIGDNTSGTNRLVPVPVTATGVLAVNTVLALARGTSFSLALAANGIVAAWGGNSRGQLGDTTTLERTAPVAVNTEAGVSALSGKTVVDIAAGLFHSLAACSDGTVAAWGANGTGQIGDNTTSNRFAPVAVNTTSGVSALYGKTVVAIAAGALHSLALCSDGTVAAWGTNAFGQLGDNTTTRRLVPVAVNTNSSVSALYGKAVVAIAGGRVHSLALCSDGTVAAWGANGRGQIGDNTLADRHAPVAVNTDSGVSALYGKAVVAIGAGDMHSLALCSDGTVAAWGFNSYGQLGDNSITSRRVPVAVYTNPLGTNQRFTHLSSGCSAQHSLAIMAAPPVSQINLIEAQSLPDGSFRLGFTNPPGAFLGVLASSNPATDVGGWIPLAGLAEVAPGQFQFTDPQATNTSQRFYRVCSP